ncbi:hypothetical protein ISS86_00350 [Candidatus Microgenomates bacterium]|nr:hypothetical protein [Candidatus Microgenomates bacterium]
MVYKKALICILVFVFFLRLPSLFEPFTYGDEGIYLTLGQAMRKGVVLYREIHDNKPPLLYLLAALTGSFSYFRLLLFLWSLLTIYLFFRLTQWLFPQNKPAIIISTSFFAVLISIHAFEGNVANAENFMLLPTIAGFLLILKNLKSKKSLLFFLSGIFFSLAALFKIPAAFDFLAALVFIFLFSFEEKRYACLAGRQAIRNILYAILGFSFPFLVTFIYFFFQNALNQYLVAAFFQNIPYLSSWASKKSQTLGLPLPLLSRTLLVALTTLVLFVWRKRTSSAVKLILLWFSFSLFAALLSSRPYPHYLLQVIPSLALSFGLIFRKSKEKIIPLFLVFIFSFSFLVFNFWRYPNFSYYLNFYQFALKMKSKNEYFSYFGSQAKVVYQVANYIQTHTYPQEAIFIWGTQPSIYALSRRLPVGRYTVSYHIVDFNGYQETMEALKEKKPSLVIKIKEEKRRFPDFEGFLRNYYLKTETIEGIEIFRRT